MNATGLPGVGAAGANDLDGVLKLQYLCYQSEAQRYDAWDLGALTETSAQLREAYENQTILVAKLGDEVVGTVRGEFTGSRLHVGRLVVHPRVQRRGLGRRLLEAIEQTAPGASYAFFTGHRSTDFLALFAGAGYRVEREQVVSSLLTLIHLEKPGTQP